MTLKSIKRRTASKRSVSIAPTKIHPKVNLPIDNRLQSRLVTVEIDGEITIRVVARIHDLVYEEIVPVLLGIDLGRPGKGHEVHDATTGKGEFNLESNGNRGVDVVPLLKNKVPKTRLVTESPQQRQRRK